ncbi:MAG: calcium/sodium antiporter [Planctomycetes bacterium]|nr:calcium/sodium antiporter [Planctomycetota bacterium]
MNFEMNITWALVLLAAGLIILWKSADVLVSGAVGLAKKFQISPLVIGLTVVAMGTSAPEVAASVAAALRNNPNIALGNVYGSNIANLALVGGLCAIISPISIRMSTLKREMPVMLGVGLLLLPILNNSFLSRVESIILLCIFVGLMALTIYYARKKPETFVAETDSSNTKEKSLLLNFVFVAVGLAGLAFGAEITVKGAVVIGAKAGLSNAVIGLTIVAIGTSLPELVTCLVAVFKGHDDISIGNLVGSNIFNTLLVTGTAGVIRPFEVVGRLKGFDYWVMISVCAGFILLGIIQKKISRTGGVILLACYVIYIGYLFI